MSSTVGIVLQARVGSTRLPGKVLKDVDGEPLIELIVDRLRHSETTDKIVLATSTNPKDDALVDFAQRKDIPVYRGSESDVLSRYVGAAREHDIDVIIRACGDCPLASPRIVDRLVRVHHQSGAEFTHCTGVPVGLEMRVVNRSTLEAIDEKDLSAADREHVTYYLEKHENEFTTTEVDFEMLSEPRLTVDVPEDIQLIRQLAKHYGPLRNVDVGKLLADYDSTNPLWEINADVIQATPDGGHSRPEISVVTTTYNSEEYVERALESVRSQTFNLNRVEHLVVDDGSDDHTVDVVRSFSDGDYIRVIETEHSGASATLNAGIDAAKGKYVIVLDSDDEFKPTILEQMYNVLEKEPSVDFVYSDYVEVFSGGRKRYVDTSDNILNTITIGIMHRRERLLEYEGYDENLFFAEYDLLLRYLKDDLEGCHIAEPLFVYHRRDKSLTGDTEAVKKGKRKLEKKFGRSLDIRDY